MSQPIITTDVSTIRPVFSQGSGENIKRYSQLKKLFADNKEYTVLAEPIPAGGDKIAWHTEFEGNIIRFNELPQDEQKEAKGRLKYQVNKLYKKAFKKLKDSNATTAEIYELFEVLDSCIEIPHYNDIYVIKSQSGKSNFVIIRWGFTSDDFNAQSKLIQKLVPIKVDSIQLKAVDSKRNTVRGENITIEIGNEVYNYKTNTEGIIYIEDVTFFTKIKAYQKESNGKKENLHEYVCDGRDEYIFRIGVPENDMTFVIVDEDGLPIGNTKVFFEYKGETIERITDKSGKVVLNGIPDSTEVICYQDEDNKEKFTCKPEQTHYQFSGIRPKGNMLFNIKQDNGEPLEKAKFRFEYSGRTIELESDKNGQIELNNIPVHAEVKATQLLNGEEKKSNSFICKAGTNEYNIKGETPVIAGPMYITVLNSEGKPIKHTTIKCEFERKEFELVSDDNGQIFLEKVHYDSEVKCTQIVDGVAKYKHNFVYLKGKEKYILRGMDVLALSSKATLEIHVKNRNDEAIPNLRVTVENNNFTHNKITDNDGVIIAKEIIRNTPVVLTTEYKNNNAKKTIECKEEREVHELILGKRKFAFLYWLIPLLLVLGVLFYFFLLPILPNLFNPIVTNDTILVRDTVVIEDTIKPPPIEKKGLTVIVLDKESENPVKNADISIEYKGIKTSGKTDAEGKINFPDVPESKVEVLMRINANNYTEQLTTFISVKEKTVYLSNESIDVSEVVLPCGQQVESKGYGSTIKTFNVKKSKGRLRILFDMFNIADKLIVYSGKSTEISEDKIIWQTKGFVSNLHRKSFPFETKDSLITVEIKGGDENKTEWYFRVYCP